MRKFFVRNAIISLTYCRKLRFCSATLRKIRDCFPQLSGETLHFFRYQITGINDLIRDWLTKFADAYREQYTKLVIYFPLSGPIDENYDFSYNRLMKLAIFHATFWQNLRLLDKIRHFFAFDKIYDSFSWSFDEICDIFPQIFDEICEFNDFFRDRSTKFRFFSRPFD